MGYATPIIEELSRARALVLSVKRVEYAFNADALMFLPFLRARRQIEVKWMLPLHNSSPYSAEILKTLTEKQLTEHVLLVFEKFECNRYYGHLLNIVPSYATAKALLSRIAKPGSKGHSSHQYYEVIHPIVQVSRRHPTVARALKDTGFSSPWRGWKK